MFKSHSSFNVLYTTDIVKTHDFYKKIGVQIKQLEEDKVVVQFSDFNLHFILNTEEPFERYNYITEPNKYGQGIIFYIETDDIVSVQKLIEEAGGIIKAPIFENLWKCKEILFEDPNGYKFAIYQEI